MYNVQWFFSKEHNIVISLSPKFTYCLFFTYFTVSYLYKAFRHVETLFVQGRNLYLAGLILVLQGLFTFRQPIAGLQGTDFYLGRIKFLRRKALYN